MYVVTVRVQRSGSIRLTSNGWIVWRPQPERPAEPLPPEWVFRALLEDGSLDDDAWILALLDRRGMVWGDLDRIRDEETQPPAPHRLPPVDDPQAAIHLAVVRQQLATLRYLVGDVVTRPGDLPPYFYRLLDKGLRPFTPLALAHGDDLMVDLYEAGCWQVFAALTDTARPRLCANEGCRHTFWRKDGAGRRTADVAYCSEACRSAAKQRRYRARNRTRLLTGSHTAGSVGD